MILSRITLQANMLLRSLHDRITHTYAFNLIQIAQKFSAKFNRISIQDIIIFYYNENQAQSDSYTSKSYCIISLLSYYFKTSFLTSQVMKFFSAKLAVLSLDTCQAMAS